MSEAACLLSLQDIARTFVQGDRRLDVLQGVSLDLHAGEIVALVGQSGSGKSTLLHIAGLLERPDGGEVVIEGRSLRGQNDAARTALRRKFLGFVYQYHHLLPEFSALENVMLPQMLAGLSRSQAKLRAAELLAMVGLQERGDHRPGRLSGGEQQRVAIARAVVGRPRLLLADEPTGNLDEIQAERLMQLFKEMNRLGTTVVVATHNDALVGRHPAPSLRLRQGRLVAPAPRPEAALRDRIDAPA